MGLRTLLQKRPTGYYFRQRVPQDLLEVYGKAEIVRSLRTKDAKIAAKLDKELAYEYECEFGLRAKGMRAVLNALQPDNLQAVPGSKSDNFRTTIIPLGKFAELLKTFKPKKNAIRNNAPVIVLKEAKHNLDDPGFDKAKRIMFNQKNIEQYGITWNALLGLQAELERINRYYEKQDITFACDDVPEPVWNGLTETQKAYAIGYNPDRRKLKRIFTGDFTKHGRLYGACWQSLANSLRSYLRIKGNPVVRLDYKAQHCHMLYVLATGNPHPETDPHSHVTNSCVGKPYPRALAKCGFNILINCMTVKEAAGAIPGKVAQDETCKKEGITIMENEALWLVKDLLVAHQPISHLLCDKDRTEPICMELFFHDSNICLNILKTAMRAKVTVLSVHDEFICEYKHKDYLQMILSAEYVEYFKATKNIELDRELMKQRIKVI